MSPAIITKEDPQVIETPIDQDPMMPATYDHTRVMTHNGIITAQRVALPRDDGKVIQKIRALAQYAADDWYYSFPVKSKDGSKSAVEGPSIKGAMAVARLYGNCQVNCAVQETPTSWIFNARFVDFETGFCLERPFQQRKGQSSMKTGDKGRQEDIAFQIGASKAIRNVICNALEFFTDRAFEAAKNSIVEKVGKNLEGYRQKIGTRLSEMNIPVRNVETLYGKPAKDWTAHEVAKIIAEIQSIQDGMATSADVFPEPRVEEKPEEKPEPKAEPTAKAEAAPKETAKQETAAPAAQKSEPSATLPLGDEQAKKEQDEAEAAWADALEPLLKAASAAKSVGELEAVLDNNEQLIAEMGDKAPKTVVKAYAQKISAYRTKLEKKG